MKILKDSRFLDTLLQFTQQNVDLRNVKFGQEQSSPKRPMPVNGKKMAKKDVSGPKTTCQVKATAQKN